MRVRVIVLMIVIAGLQIACSKDDSNPSTPTTPQVLMPLAVGNEWIYQYSRYLNGQLDTTEIRTIHIYRTMVDSLGRTCYTPIEKDTIIMGGSNSIWMVNTNRGYEMFGDLLGVFVFPYPVQAGYTYSLDTKLMYYNMVVSSTDTLITVPAGTFTCYRYDYHTEENMYFASDFYSPGFGKVYSIIVNFDGTIAMKDELIEYHLEE